MLRRIAETRKFDGKPYTRDIGFSKDHEIRDRKDQLKYEAFTKKCVVSFRTVRETVSGKYYRLYYRFHSEQKRHGRK